MEQIFLSAAERAPFAQIFARVQRTHPLVDCITNIVTVNDVANGLLAIDARPVMASAPEEIAYFMERADALLLNLGATGAEQRTAMLAGAEAANALVKPVVVDPVGVGTSPLRRDTLAELLATRQISCIRGNISEIKALAGLSTDAGGVDASEADLADPAAFALAARMARELAAAHNTVIAISGPRDNLRRQRRQRDDDARHRQRLHADRHRCRIRSGSAEEHSARSDGGDRADVSGWRPGTGKNRSPRHRQLPHGDV